MANNTNNNAEEAKKLEEAKKAEELKKAEEANKPKEYIVKTQVPNYNGIVAGVQFAYGKSAVPVKEGWILEWFKEKGYAVEEVK